MKYDNTYSQIFYHVVFAVRNRESLILPGIKDEVYSYISGIVANQKQKLFIINGMPDHIHMLLNCRPNMNLSNLVAAVKEHSGKLINSKGLLRGKFYWQEGFGAFTIGKKDVGPVLNYIKTQEEHHTREAFRVEMQRLLKENEVDYREEYFGWGRDEIFQE
jgi:putative transposase